MTDSMLPILRQMFDAEDDRALARLLLIVPDAILITHQHSVLAVCRKRRFEAGEAFVFYRLSVMRAVRGADGQIAQPLAQGLQRFRAGMAAYAAGRAP